LGCEKGVNIPTHETSAATEPMKTITGYSLCLIAENMIRIAKSGYVGKLTKGEYHHDNTWSINIIVQKGLRRQNMKLLMLNEPIKDRDT
jgi:hypothetical protein